MRLNWERSPFLEAESIGFKYGDVWQESVFADDEGTPYLIYLSAGKHQISMTVTASDMSNVRTKLTEAVAEMSDLYVDITKNHRWNSWRLPRLWFVQTNRRYGRTLEYNKTVSWRCAWIISNFYWWKIRFKSIGYN